MKFNKIRHLIYSQIEKNVSEVVESKSNPIVEDLAIPKSTTGLKEGLVMYFACQTMESIDEAMKKIETKSNKKLKFSKNIIKDSLYNGNEEPAATNVKDAINYLNNSVVDPKIGRTYINAMTAAKRIIKDIGTLDPNLIDRGQKFGDIKKKATELLQGAEINIGAGESDKWCPADMFIYGSNRVSDDAKKCVNINIDSEKQKSLNALFHTDFSKPSADSILGISLKEESARAGKATSFRKILKGDTDYVVADKDESQEVITKLLYNFSSIMRTKGANIEPVYKVGDCAEALNTMIRNQSSIIKNVDPALFDSLKQSLTLTLKKTFGKDAQSANNKDNAKRMYKKGGYTYPNEDTKEIKQLKVGINEFRRSLIDYSKKKYSKSRKNFLDTLKKSNFKQPDNPPVKWAETEDVSKVSDIFLKKAGCYEAAAKLLDAYQVKSTISLPNAFKSIVKQEKNVFLALTAYAVSQGGISPTFFKLIGKESSSQTAEVKKFPSDGVLKLVPGGEVQIDDSPTNAGFNVTFICQIKSKTEVKDKYKVVLSFSYAGTQFKIEVFELSEA